MPDYVSEYVSHIRDEGNFSLADSIEKNSQKADSLYLSQFGFDSKTGLLLGNVQSGKTAQMFGIMCAAYEHGIPVFILLTTDSIELQTQTLKRVNQDLGDLFCVCGEQDTIKFRDNELKKPCIIVLKKNTKILKEWADVLKSTGYLNGNSLMIVDDEGDAASLNTLVNQRRQSSVNKQLSRIREDSMSTLYLEVTGTPQALILQTAGSDWQPEFIQYFEPGKGYLGGNFFFAPANKEKVIEFIDHDPHPVQHALIHHLTVSAQLLFSSFPVSNALFHPGIRTNTHDQIRKEIEDELRYLKSYPDKLDDAIEKCWQVMEPEKSEKISLKDIQEKAAQLLDGNINIVMLNSVSRAENADWSGGCNIMIGGNTLGRGVTFPALNTVYYSRTAKKPQMDTMWQHNRMFGYDRDPGLVKIWMTEKLYKLFCDINQVNNSLISQIEKGLSKIKLIAPEGVNPTRKNVIDKRNVDLIPGGTNYYPFNPENINLNHLEKLLGKFGTDAYNTVSLKLIDEILSCIKPSDDFDIDAFRSALKAMLAQNPLVQGILIVRRNRSVTQGTGALLSPTDWKLANSFEDKTVLTMYQMSPKAKGWKQPGLWVPNIKLPSDMIYYDVKDA